MKDLEPSIEEGRPDARIENLAAMKMTVYLLCQFMDTFEKESVEPSAMIGGKVCLMSSVWVFLFQICVIIDLRVLVLGSQT